MRRKESSYEWFLRKLFPGDAPWQRRKKLRNLLLAGLFGALLGGSVLVFAWLQNAKPAGQ